MEQGPKTEMGGEQLKNYPELSAREMDEKKSKVESQMMNLKKLDFKILAEVLDWLNEFPTDYKVDSKDKILILKTFKEHGFIPYVDKNSREKEENVLEDRDKSARKLIGISLQFLKQYGDMSDLMPRDIMYWKGKFGSVTGKKEA